MPADSAELFINTLSSYAANATANISTNGATYGTMGAYLLIIVLIIASIAFIYNLVKVKK